MKSGGTGCVIGVMLLLASTSVVANLNAQTQEPLRTLNFQEGSLFGYVYDTNIHPIENATITATCGDFIFMNSSDSTGYYYIGHVPIVDCLWTISASKRGYNTVYVERPIDENTTRDFILKPLGHIIYVDDIPGEGPGNPPENFTRIQDAIDVSSDNDTVFVYNGIYNENIVVNKTIQLQGENREATIIEGDGKYNRHIVELAADYTVFSGFKVQYGDNYDGGGLFVYSNYCSIHHNLLTSNWWWAISVYGSHDNVVYDNIVSTNLDGIQLFGCHHNVIVNNTIVDNLGEGEYKRLGFGIYVDVAYGNDISNNFIKGNRVGIFIKFAWNNAITKNTLDSNKVHASFLYFIIGNHRNDWKENYWGKPVIAPKVIYGLRGLAIGWSLVAVPWLNFDWHPALKPYDIEGDW